MLHLNNKLKSILIIPLFAALSSFSQQLHNLEFYQYGINEGLSHSDVRAVYKDRNGFLWLGTRDGLNKFDGYQFSVYRRSKQGENGISSNDVKAITGDRQGSIWIGTIAGGINVLDARTQRFKVYLKSTGDGDGISSNNVECLMPDRDDNIWIGTDLGISLYNRSTGKFSYFKSDINNPATLSANQVTCFWQDGDGIVWIGTSQGVNSYDPQSGKLSRYPANKTSSTVLSRIKFIFEDSNKNLWVGTYGQGIQKLNRQTGTFDAGDSFRELSQFKNVLSMDEDKDGNLWIGTENQGLVIYHPKTKLYTVYAEDDGFDLGSNTVNAVHCDEQGNTWIATTNAGLKLVNANQRLLTHYKFNKKGKGISHNVVNALVEDASGKLWIGTDGGGLDRFDIAGRQFTNINQQIGKQKNIPGNYVLTIQPDKEKRLWIGTWGDGVTVFNPDNNYYKQYINQIADSNSLSNNKVYCILKDSKDQIWLGTYGGGLNRYDPTTNHFIRYTIDRGTSMSLSSNYILCMQEGPGGKLYIGTDGGGLNILDPKTGLIKIVTRNEITQELSNNSIRDIWIDPLDNIWLATSYGLNRIDAVTGKIRCWHSDDGLPNDVVAAVQGDGQNNIWVSTARGAARLTFDDKMNSRFIPVSGLQSAEFRSAKYIDKTGKMYFGSTQGFYEFHPAAIRNEPSQAPLVFTGFEIFNKPVSIAGENGEDTPLKENINSLKEITLSYKESVISFSFAQLDYNQPGKKQYAYRMEGFNKNWQFIGNKNSVTFTNLDPGTYWLEVKSIDADNQLSPISAKLKITITPPFWKEWWFKALLTIALFACVALVFYGRLKVVHQRNKFLEAEVLNRTKELRQSNKLLQENNQTISIQNKELATYNKELDQKTGKILEQQEHIIKQNHELEQTVQQLEISNQTKDLFFSILAHDLKNPVAALAGITDVLRTRLGALSHQEVAGYLEDIHKSSGSIHELLVNLLDWARLQQHSLPCRPEAVNVYETIIRNYSLSEQLIKRKNLRIQVSIDRSHTIYADRLMTDTVFRNILTNSIKYTPADGVIELSSVEEENNIVVVFHDSGVGMSEQQLKSLFDINKQQLTLGTAGERGTGLGLMITKDFIDVNKGAVEVTSELGSGTSFYVRFPKIETGMVPGTIKDTSLQSSSASTVPADPALIIGEEYRGRKILIIEDSVEIRSYLKLLLSPYFEVYESENGDTGFEQAVLVQPAVVISDVVMPVMDGLALCEKLKKDQRTSHIPLILLTAQDNEEHQAQGYRAGAEAYLTKPVQKNILFQVIRNFIRNQEIIRKKFAQSDELFPAEVQLGDPDKEFMDKVLEYIEAHLSEPELDYKKICEITTMSRTILYAKFKSLTGHGVHDFIKSIRLKKSLLLLQEGRLNVNQVAYEVGFNTASYFSKSFIKAYGMSPTDYITQLKLMTHPGD